MEIIDTPLPGLLVLQAAPFADLRGGFLKPFSAGAFAAEGLASGFREFYYSVNRRHVVRGMHFQTPPAEHVKLVYVSRGRIVDVVVDLRKSSPAYGRYFATELDAASGKYLYIPAGFAHGFCALREGTIVNYAQTSCYDRAHDCGIRYDSFGFPWPVEAPVVSTRDLAFPQLKDFNSPF